MCQQDFSASVDFYELSVVSNKGIPTRWPIQQEPALRHPNGDGGMMHRTATCLLLGWLWVVQGFAQGSIAWKEWGQGPFAEAKHLGRSVLVDAEATWCH